MLKQGLCVCQTLTCGLEHSFHLIFQSKVISCCPGMEGGLEVQKHWHEKDGLETGHWLGPAVQDEKEQIQKHKGPKRHFFFAGSEVS